MKQLCEILGGSHLYGLNTPASDIDRRGVFINDTVSDIVGLTRYECDVKVINGDDRAFYELRHFFNMLRAGNSQMIELLYCQKFVSLNPMFKEYVLDERTRFMDTEKVFRCLCGYMQSERKLANGERKGKIAGKRYEAVLKHGFSPKNFVQLIRLATCGIRYFLTGEFPTHFADDPQTSMLVPMLLSIKTEPEKHDKKTLNDIVDDLEKQMKFCFDNRTFTHKFDAVYANEVLLRFYFPPLSSFKKELDARNGKV